MAAPEADPTAPPVALAKLVASARSDATAAVAAVVAEPKSRREMDDADRLVLQGYGRPYDAAGKPSGVFYSHAKPGPLPMLVPEA